LTVVEPATRIVSLAGLTEADAASNMAARIVPIVCVPTDIIVIAGTPGVGGLG
jgi:hypothetical protein